MMKTFAMLGAIAAVGVQAGANGNGNGFGMGGQQGNAKVIENGIMRDQSICPLTALQIQQRTLPQTTIDNLLFMREEEKLARDVYQVLNQQWQVNVFANISQSEQQHMDQVKLFLDAYGLADSAKAEVGLFNNQSLQTLYDQLVQQGSISQLEAFKAGALIEEVDIRDLEVVIANTDIAELKTMYTRLLYGSHNHLRAFSQQISRLLGSYSAQVLTQEQVDAILNGTQTSILTGNANRLSNGVANPRAVCFVSNLTVAQQAMQNGGAINDNQPVNINYQVSINNDDVGKTAEWLMVAVHNPSPNEPAALFVRNAQQWQNWNGQASGLPAASPGTVLQSQQTLTVFDGVMNLMPGQYSIYTGYRLQDDSIVYNQNPLVFSVAR